MREQVALQHERCRARRRARSRRGRPGAVAQEVVDHRADARGRGAAFVGVNLITPHYKSEARILVEGRENIFFRPEAEKA